ncbi:MAG: Stk1 family PASTA domain-containing Ser/Thr kinase [Ruminococcaceae bacterium]|nr:Stk1 family PASTA domain-containing Ser/Thr kinase [Oscillospiraceae bacterium]
MLDGRLIGNRYEIVETIGKGGMAIVYKAKCQVLNRYVALKVLRPEFREDKEFVSRFQAEAQSAGSLSHPNIVSIYDVGQDGDLDYIVMEYVEGVTLKQYMEAKGIIPWREAVDYAAQICAGLEHAHRNGIIHKDIKPHNVIITREGTIKITDFGIAKVISSSTIKTGNATMGSVHYFSPEQARGGYTDNKTDIYSLGVVLYEMVTGELPFRGDTAIAIAMQHIEKDPVPPTQLNADVPEGLENVILRAMCKDQAYRYDSVTQTLVDLKKVYTGNTVDYSEILSGGADIEPLQENKIMKKEEKQSSKKSDLVAIISGIVAGFVIVAMLVFGFKFIGGLDQAEKLELPDFTGLTIEEAKQMVVNSQLSFEIEKEEVSANLKPGAIISHSPGEGKMVKENAVIKVVISKGEGEFPMPDLTNRKQEAAEEILDEKGLRYSVVTEVSETIPEGYVTRQTPEAGIYIDKATTITVYVSSGKEKTTVEVPNLLGLSEEEAKIALLESGLTYGDIIREESSKKKGTVISQSVRPGYELKEKSSIDIKVSSGGKESGATAAPSQAPTQAPATTPTPTKKPSGGVPIVAPNAGGVE